MREIPVSSTEGWRDDYYRGKIVSIPSLFTIQFAAVNHAWTRIDLMFPWRVHVMRTMRCAQVHDDEWAFTPRAESWLSSKDPTICKPELGRTPTIHRFFRFTPAQSCILIRADFIRNAWQLNASGSFGSFSRSSSFVSSYFYCIFQNYRRVLMRSMTRFQFVIFNLFIEKTMRNCKNYISKENFLFFSSNWGKLSYKCIFLQILRYL